MKITKEKIVKLIMEEFDAIEASYTKGRSERKAQDVERIVNIMNTKMQATEVQGLLRILERDYGHVTGTGERD